MKTPSLPMVLAALAMAMSLGLARDLADENYDAATSSSHRKMMQASVSYGFEWPFSTRQLEDVSRYE